jgi:hypothetical protein
MADLVQIHPLAEWAAPAALTPEAVAVADFKFLQLAEPAEAE